MGKHKQKGPFNCYKGELRGEIQHFCRENAISEEDFIFCQFIIGKMYMTRR